MTDLHRCAWAEGDPLMRAHLRLDAGRRDPQRPFHQVLPTCSGQRSI